MGEIEREELTVRTERVLLMGVILPSSKSNPRDPLGELRSLARTAGARVADEMVARRRKPHPGLYIGTGKARQLAGRCEQNEIDAVIFDNDLSPGQIRELEAATSVKVIDRSELILDIFASAARTVQGRLQVELAQLEYTYPRLTGLWTHLDRHGGGIGTRGPGERQIETDRRLVQKRISLLRDKLESIDSRRLREVKKRGDTYCVCLVGYTNAGKSTMMNRLTGGDMYVADRLFATLETRTRKCDLGGGVNVLLSDTVGFIRDIPHHLVASFRATLEEAIFADLLIHVADASNDRVEMEISEVRSVLEDLGCESDRQMLVLNKIDRIMDPTVYTVLREKFPGALFVSAKEGGNIEALVREVALRSGGVPLRVRLEANFRNGRLMSCIARHAQVEKQTYDDSVVYMEAVVPASGLEDIRTFGEDVEILPLS